MQWLAKASTPLLACAQGAEVLSCARHDIVEEFKDDATSPLAPNANVKVHSCATATATATAAAASTSRAARTASLLATRHGCFALALGLMYTGGG